MDAIEISDTAENYFSRNDTNEQSLNTMASVLLSMRQSDENCTGSNTNDRSELVYHTNVENMDQDETAMVLARLSPSISMVESARPLCEIKTPTNPALPHSYSNENFVKRYSDPIIKRGYSEDEISLMKLNNQVNDFSNLTNHGHPSFAYAKLQGFGWDFFLSQTSIVLGKSPEVGSSAAEEGVDVFLGAGNGTLSKKHIRIGYDPDIGKWQAFCLGRSGIHVDGVFYEPFCHPINLVSRSLIVAGGVAFYFLLPVPIKVRNTQNFDPVKASTFDTKVLQNQPITANYAPKSIVSSHESQDITSSRPNRTRRLISGPPLMEQSGFEKESKKKSVSFSNFNLHNTDSKTSSEDDSSVEVKDEANAEINLPISSAIRADNESIKSKNNDSVSMDENGFNSEKLSESSKLTKPPYSYAYMISEAIESSNPDPTKQRMTLAGIYQFLSDKYPYFKYTKTGWQNSVRHNLSLNKLFRRVPRINGESGKGMLWIVDKKGIEKRSDEDLNSSSNLVRRVSVGGDQPIAGHLKYENAHVYPEIAPNPTLNIGQGGGAFMGQEGKFNPQFKPLVLPGPRAISSVQSQMKDFTPAKDSLNHYGTTRLYPVENSHSYFQMQRNRPLHSSSMGQVYHHGNHQIPNQGQHLNYSPRIAENGPPTYFGYRESDSPQFLGVVNYQNQNIRQAPGAPPIVSHSSIQPKKHGSLPLGYYNVNNDPMSVLSHPIHTPHSDSISHSKLPRPQMNNDSASTPINLNVFGSEKKASPSIIMTCAVNEDQQTHYSSVNQRSASISYISPTGAPRGLQHNNSTPDHNASASRN